MPALPLQPTCHPPACHTPPSASTVTPAHRKLPTDRNRQPRAHCSSRPRCIVAEPAPCSAVPSRALRPSQRNPHTLPTGAVGHVSPRPPAGLSPPSGQVPSRGNAPFQKGRLSGAAVSPSGRGPPKSPRPGKGSFEGTLAPPTVLPTWEEGPGGLWRRAGDTGEGHQEGA